jgi:phospholipid/cholesterol/gamma-HCH transport system substrate-binding protein
MPTQEKKRWAQLKVGLLAVSALALLAFLIFLMTSSKGLFKSRSEIYTYLDDSAAIAVGAPVRLNGITAGKVAGVNLSGLNEPNRIVRITMEVNNEFLPLIPVDSLAGIAAENLLGTKYINIKKGRSQTAVKSGAEIKALDTPEIQDIVQQGSTALAALQQILTRLDGIISSVEVGQGTIGKLLSDEELYRRLVGIASETQKVIAALNSDQSTLGKLMHEDTLYTDLRGTIAHVDMLLSSLQQDLQGQGTVGKLMKDPALYDDARSTIGDVRKLLAGIDQGQGTVGKLLKSDDLHNQLQATMGRLDALLDKVNGGQGTIGQLLDNPALYESLEGTTRELTGLLKDFRANPKKFLRIRVTIF